jgi:DNA-damage-inducible protein J
MQGGNQMAQVNIRIDDNIKDRADVLFDELGMNMTTAFTMFIKAALRQNGIPFELSIDPFYSESNMKVLRESIRDADEGKLTEHELIDV